MTTFLVFQMNKKSKLKLKQYSDDCHGCYVYVQNEKSAENSEPFVQCCMLKIVDECPCLTCLVKFKCSISCDRYDEIYSKKLEGNTIDTS